MMLSYTQWGSWESQGGNSKNRTYHTIAVIDAFHGRLQHLDAGWIGWIHGRTLHWKACFILFLFPVRDLSKQKAVYESLWTDTNRPDDPDDLIRSYHEISLFSFTADLNESSVCLQSLHLQLPIKWWRNYVRQAGLPWVEARESWTVSLQKQWSLLTWHVKISKCGPVKRKGQRDSTQPSYS